MPKVDSKSVAIDLEIQVHSKEYLRCECIEEQAKTVPIDNIRGNRVVVVLEGLVVLGDM